jgi:hypothetical protein
MMTWNYRVFREESGEHVIREVYYDEDGAIVACTEDPVEPMGESLEELAKDLAYFQKALSHPVLSMADIPEGKLEAKAEKGIVMSHEELLAELGIDRTASVR